MDLVVDTSVLIAVIANQPEKAALVDATRGRTLLAPPSVHWEIGNAFSAMLKRSRITQKEVLQAIDAYQQIALRYATVELKESLLIAAKLGIYAYDAYLIRCAQKYEAPLITLDRKLSRLAQEEGIEVLEYQ